MSDKTTKIISELKYKDKIFHFKYPIRIFLEHDAESGESYYTYPRWGLWGFGTSLRDALDDFADSLDFAWEEYALCNGSVKMTDGAINLKQELLQEVTVKTNKKNV
jgi:hypothetical protein